VRHLVEILLKEFYGFRTTVVLEVIDLTLVGLDKCTISANRTSRKRGIGWIKLTIYVTNH
jgi:hypothetical protein